MIARLLFAQFLVFFLFSCGDSKEPVEIEKEDEDSSANSLSLTGPDAPRLPGDSQTKGDWAGSKFAYQRQFREVFENVEVLREIPPGAGPEYEIKRDENDSGLVPVSKGRLRYAQDGMPFDGKIYRHYLSGELEFYARYEDGFRRGRAYWWNKEGNLTKVAQGWGYDYEEVEFEEHQDNPHSQLDPELRRLSPSAGDSSLFSGTIAEWEKWSTINTDKQTLDLSTGEFLNGSVRIFDEDGYLQSRRSYKEGRLDGKFANYHRNGVQAQSIVYENGVKNGAETWWGENGFKSHETHYLMGNLHGKTYSWNEKGHLVSEVEYADGKPLYPVKEFSREGVEQ